MKENEKMKEDTHASENERMKEDTHASENERRHPRFIEEKCRRKMKEDI